LLEVEETADSSQLTHITDRSTLLSEQKLKKNENGNRKWRETKRSSERKSGNGQRPRLKLTQY